MVTSAAPALYDCESPEDVADKLDAQSLTGAKHRFNVRGVLREENGAAKRYIVHVGITPLDAVVSLSATRLCCGLSMVTGDVVLPVPVGRILDDPLQGMAVRRDDDKIIGANRVWLLVRGQCETKMDPLHDKMELTSQEFKVFSEESRCLLSDPAEDTDGKVNLVGYCDFHKMLTYRLDKEAALVLASAVQCPDGKDGACRTATIEHVVKLSKDEVTALQRSMAVEWKAILTSPPEAASPAASQMSTKDKDGDYWSEGRQRKVRRIVSEPHSPMASVKALAGLLTSPH